MGRRSRGTAVSLTYEAELGNLRAALAQLPDVGDKEAKILVDRMDKQFQRAEKLAARSASATQKAWEQSFKRLQVAAVAGATAAAGALYGLSQRVANLRNDLSDMSARTGVSATTLAGLRLAAEGAGAKLSDFESGLSKLSSRMNDARDGTGKAADAWRKLGVEVTGADGQLRSADDVLRDTWERLRAVENETERNAIGTELLGRSYGKLEQALGDVPLDAFTRQAKILGTDVTPEAAAAAARWQRATGELSQALEGAASQLFDLVDMTGQVEKFTLGFVYLKQMAIGALEDFGNVLGRTGKLMIQLQTGNVAGAVKSMYELQVAGRKNEAQARATAEAFFKNRKEIDANAKEAGSASKTLGDYEGGVGGAGRALDRTTESARKLREEIERQAAALRMSDRLWSIEQQALGDTWTAHRRLREAQAAQLDQIGRLRAAGADAADADAAEAAVRARYKRDLARLETEAATEVTQAWVRSTEETARAFGDLERVTEAIHARMQEALRERLEEIRMAVDTFMGFGSQVAGYLAEIHADRIDDIRKESNERTDAFKKARQEERARIDDLLARGKIDEDEHARMLSRLKEENKEKHKAHREQRRHEHQMMMRGWRAQKRAQRAQAVIAASRATMALIPALSYLGPAAPPTAAAIVGAELAMQLRRISRQEAPSFPMGGRVASRLSGPSPGMDHAPIQVRRDEGVVSPRGMSRLGDRGLDELNRGGSPVQHTTIMIGRRTLAEAVTTVGGTSRLDSRRGRVSGQVPVFGGG